MSLRLKLVLAFAALTGLVLATTVALTYSAVEAAAGHKVATDVKGAVQFFNSDVEQFRARTQLQIQSELKQIRGDPEHAGYGSLLDELDRLNSDDAEFGLVTPEDARAQRLPALRHFQQVVASADLTNLKSNALFLIADKRGEILFNEAAPETAAVDLPGLSMLSACLQGQPGAELWSRDFLQHLRVPLVKAPLAQNDLLLVICEPLTRAHNALGAVLLGQSVLPRLSAFESLNEAPDASSGGARPSRQVALAIEAARDGGLAGSDPAIIQALAKDPHRTQVNGFLLAAAGRTYAVQGLPIAPLPGSRVFLMRDVKPEIAEFLRAFFGRSFFLSLLGISLMALLLAQLLSQRLAAPLVRLESAAREIQHGNLDVQVEALGRDEVGRLAETFNQMVAGLRQRDQIKGLFKRYLDPRVVDELIRHPEKASPGGERRVLTLLFSDLVGFTTASEKMTPEELVALLNRYFETATRALAKHGATLDKFIGDAIMCFWNAPLPDDAHAAKACLSALALLDVVDALREPFRASGFDTFDCRIGINTGGCVVGNLGSTDTQYYTAIGDAVNLASRLEGACKVYGTRTLVSEATVLQAGPAVAVRELDQVRVKGRGHPVRVFELLGPGGMARPARVERFEAGLAQFRARRFEDALALFSQSPDDPPSQVFAERCRLAISHPPGEDWDGVHTLSTK